MLMIIITFFAAAALLGVYLLSYVLQAKNTPKGVVFIHGPLAATGLVLLILYAALYRTDKLLVISIVLFALAAVGGIFLLLRDFQSSRPPKLFAILHGVIALLGFLFLCAYVFL